MRWVSREDFSRKGIWEVQRPWVGVVGVWVESLGSRVAKIKSITATGLLHCVT